MPRWPDIAKWVGPTPNTSGSISDHMYVVVHTASGSYDGTIAWQKNPSANVSSHFIVAKDGRIAQMLDTNAKGWTQIEGNPYSISIENEGNENTPLTAPQIEACARILARAHQVHGVPLQLTGRVGTRGLGHHSMGAESGANWGHSQCPGSIIKAQKPAILARAIQLAGGQPPTPESTTGGDDMIYRIPNGACYVPTVNGPVQLISGELPAGAPVAQVASSSRLNQLCPAVAPAAFTDAQVTAIVDRLVASGANGLGPADHAGIVADVKDALNTAHLSTT